MYYWRFQNDVKYLTTIGLGCAELSTALVFDYFFG